MTKQEKDNCCMHGRDKVHKSKIRVSTTNTVSFNNQSTTENTRKAQGKDDTLVVWTWNEKMMATNQYFVGDVMAGILL